jgi:hypothetical protein
MTDVFEVVLDSDKWRLASVNEQKACLAGIVVVARATLPSDDAKLGAYVRARLTALGLL